MKNYFFELYFVPATKKFTQFNGGYICNYSLWRTPGYPLIIQGTPTCCTSKDHILYEEFKIE